MYRKRNTLPELQHLVSSSRLGDLTDAISFAIGPHDRLTHFEHIEEDDGKLGTGLYYVAAHEGAHPIAIPSTPAGIAAHLVNQAAKTDMPLRYPRAPSTTAQRGWKLSSLTIDGVKAILAETAWVEPVPA